MRHHHLPNIKTCAILALSALLLSGCGGDWLAPESDLEVAKGSVQSAALSPQADLAVVGSLHHGVSLWRLADQERVFDWRHHDHQPTIMATADFAAAAPLAATAEQNTLTLWQLDHGRALRFWSAPADILALQLDAGGSRALLGLRNHSAVLFDAQQGGVLRSFQHSAEVVSVALGQSTALTGSRDGTARLWDLQSGKKIAEVKHRDTVELVALSADGQLALSIGKQDRAVLWHSNSGETVGEINLSAGYMKPGRRITAARFSDDGRFLLLGQSGQKIILWDIANWQPVARWKLPKTRRWPPTNPSILAVAFTQQEHRFTAIASNGRVYHLTHRPHPSH